MTAPRMYAQLADWWPLMSDPSDYEEEAGIFRATLEELAAEPIRSLLELGSGGGHNASHLKQHYEMTLVEPSMGMREVSRALNPECEHVLGDMRDVRLERDFDAVFVHDAISYLTTEADLRAAFELVADQRPGAVLIEALDDDGGFDLVAAIRSLDGPYGNDVPVIMVGPSEARWRPDAIETGITEWLVWPSSSSYVRTKLQAWHLRRSARWQRAEPTADEDTRLAALHALGVLDTAAEDRFDRLTREIAEALDVPVALVSLVDRDRQWFKSRFGTDIVETPRDTSICAHAIHGGDILEVPDALADDRFADNPIVRGEPRIRFYAGMPLRLSDGSAVGTLCVVDHRPRQLNDAQLAELRRVGRMVTAELEAAEPATPRR